MQHYNKNVIFDFCDGYALAKKEGLVVSDNSKFFAKFLESLYSLGTLVRNDQYSLWNRKQCSHFHTWISYKGGEFILNSRREDDWSNNLVNECISIYDKENVTEWVKFTKTDEYKENVALISGYYKRSGGYFRHYIRRVEEGGILDEHSYKRFVENKYASKVSASWKVEPKFQVGSLVDFRTNRRCTRREDGVGGEIHKTAPNGLLVLSNTEPIISACKGAKRYKVVCIGDTVPFWTEERYLKKRTKKR